jgi:hypothetical protein
MVLLHNGGFCTGWTTELIWLLQAFPADENNIHYMTKNTKFFLLISAFAIEQLSNKKNICHISE